MGWSDYDLAIRAFGAAWNRFERSGMESLTEPERVIFCTWQFVCEVNNGGFHQYFTNPAGDFAHITVAALEKAEMPFAASLLRQALAAFPPGAPSKDQTTRFDEVRRLPHAIQHALFDRLDGEFYNSAEDPYRLQAEYVRRNAGQFAGLAK